MRKISMIVAIASVLLCVYGRLGYAEGNYGKDAVAQTLQQIALKHQTAADASLPRAVVESEAAPYAYREETPDDVDTLMARVEAQNGALVEEFEHLIAKDPLNPEAPKWLSQVAEFHYQMAHYAYLRARRQWQASLETCGDEANCSLEPVADYSAAIDDYRRLYTTYPDYRGMDEVLFRLGDALIRNRQAKEGVSYLHRLTQNYPDYRDLDAAYLAMGEYYFSQKNTGTAQAAYRKILEDYPNSAYRQYAEYKLAWTYLNLGDEDSYRTAIELFKSVVESIDTRYAAAIGRDGLIDENKLKAGEVSFRNQALNDLSMTYAELPMGWCEARAYLMSKLPEEKAIRKVEQLGQILEHQGKYEEEIELYGELLEDYRLNSRVPQWLEYRISAFNASNRKAEAETESRRAVYALLPSEEWYEANRQDDRVIQNARRFNAENLYRLALSSLMAGEETGDIAQKKERFHDAEQSLRLAHDHYLKEVSSFDFYYSFAYVLDEVSDMELRTQSKDKNGATASLFGHLREAAQVYQRVITWENPDAAMREQIRIAANRQVFVYANILAASDPTWSIDNSAKTQNFVEEKRDGKIFESVPLTESELDFVRSVEQYASLYPMDEETPAFLWRAAEIYRAHYDYDQAAQRFDQIVTHFPNHRYAAVSVGSMFELYYKANRYDKIEYWANVLRKNENFKHYTARELEDTSAFAIDKQAEALAISGKIDAAVSTLMRIETSFPERADLRTQARLKSAAMEEERHGYKAAAEWLSPISEMGENGADTLENAAHAAYRLGGCLSRIARYEEAAQAWMRSAEMAFSLVDNPEIEPTPQGATKKSRKTSKIREKSVPQTTTLSLSEEQRKEAGLAVLYALPLLKAFEDRPKQRELLDLYIQKNHGGDFDICRVDEEIRVCRAFHRDDAQASNVAIVGNLASASLERAALFDTPAESYAYLSSRDFGESREASSQHWNRRIHLDAITYALKARNTDAANQALKTLTPDESWTNAELAELAFDKGQLAQAEFESVILEFPIRTLRKRIEEKAKKRQNAEKWYKEAIQYKNAKISTAASYALAQMALHFRDAFRALPMPDELANDPDGLESYTTWIEDELVYPAEDAAASLLDVAHQITLQLESYTHEAYLSASALAELKPDEYPIVQSSLDPLSSAASSSNR